MGTLTPKHVHLLPDVYLEFHLEERWRMDVQTRCHIRERLKIEVTIEC